MSFTALGLPIRGKAGPGESSDINLQYAILEVSPTGTNDHLVLNRLSENFRGTIVLKEGTWDIAGTVYMRPFVYFQGKGINATNLVPRGTITMFGFDSTVQNYNANVQSWGLKDCTLYGYGNDSIAVNTKISTYAMQDVVIERVYFDGFSSGTAGTANYVVNIGDPWGLRFINNIIEQTGTRPAMLVQANSSSKDGSMIISNKIKNNNGNNLVLSGLEGCQIIGNELYTNAASGYNILGSSLVANIISLNKIRFGGGNAIALISTSLGNVLTGNVCQGDGVNSLTGISFDASSISNGVIGGTVFNYTSANLAEGTALSNRFVGVYSGVGFTDSP